MKPIARASLFVLAVLLVPAVFAADAWLAHAGAGGAAARSIVHALGLAGNPVRVALVRAPAPAPHPTPAVRQAPAPTPAPAADAPCCDDVVDAVVAIPSPASAVATIALAASPGTAMVANTTSNGFSYTTSDATPSGFSWALIEPGSRGVTSMSEGDDWKRLERLRSKVRVTTAWFRLNDREWTSTDAALIAELRRTIAPVEALGRRQGELGGRQGTLGGEQGRLGAKLGALGGRLAELSLRQASRRNDDSTERERAAIEREMEAIGREMDALGRRQEALGQRQGALGREQETASQTARREAREIFERAKRDGRLIGEGAGI